MQDAEDGAAQVSLGRLSDDCPPTVFPTCRREVGIDAKRALETDRRDAGSVVLVETSCGESNYGESCYGESSHGER